MGTIVAKLHIDPDACQGHGRCYSLSPDLFESDDVGTGLVSRADLESTDLAAARAAQAACPEDAILIDLVE